VVAHVNGDVRDILIRVLGDSRDAEQKLNKIARRIIDTGRLNAKPSVDLAGLPAVQAKLAALRVELEAIDHTAVSPEVKLDVDAALTRVAALQARLTRAFRTPTAQRDVGAMGRLFADAAKEVGDIGGVLAKASGPTNALNAQFQGLLGAVKQVNPIIQGLALAITAALIPAFIALASTVAGAVVGFGALLTGVFAIAGPIILGVVAVVQRLSAVMNVRQMRQAAMAAQTRKAAQADEFHRQRAEALRTAHNGVRDALQQRQRAQRDLDDAQKQAADEIAQAHRDAADAARNVAQTSADAFTAMRDAAERAKDAVLDLQDAQLGQKEADLRLKEAKLRLREYAAEAGVTGKAFESMFKKFQDVDFDPKRLREVMRAAGGKVAGGDEDLKLQRLILDVQEARLGQKRATDQVHDSTVDLKDAEKENNKYVRDGIRAYQPYVDALRRARDATAHLAEVEKQGISGNPQVINARDAVRDANERLREAQHNLSNATKRTGQDALDYANGPLAIYQKALSKLSKPERGMLDRVIAIGKAFRNAGREGSDAFIKGLNSALDTITGGALSGVGKAVSAIGQALGTNVAALAQDLTTGAWPAAWGQFGKAAAGAVNVLTGKPLRDLLAILRNIALAVLPEFSKGADTVGNS
jgi:hypothetical protein